ncbi:Alpha/Beta hydrolase protein [Phaeosphaeria sp. MPI-PUGE-AT-0046c]|nr:Alpha/Beta hydrolase protein [Phaeosphaeria sp. MPI-PUGE-AT-0046c]
MPELTVPGAVLHYETFGTGPLFVFIPGAQGTGKIFHASAQILSAHFTVLCWDRRGYSQSQLVGPQDFKHRLQTDADDAQRLIQSLSPDVSATVFGTSSGAIVAQQLLATHPESVLKLISHEPPAFSVLSSEFKVQATGLLNHVYSTYRAQGPETAMNVFASGLSEGPDSKAMLHEMDTSRGDEIRANCLFWFEFEILQYTSAEVDIEGLKRSEEKLSLVAGEESGEGPGVGPLKVISRIFHKDIARIPGGHLGYIIEPDRKSNKLSSPANKKSVAPQQPYTTSQR